MAVCGFFDFNLHYIQMFQNLHKTTWEWGLSKGVKNRNVLFLSASGLSLAFEHIQINIAFGEEI